MKKKIISIFLLFTASLTFSEENTVEVRDISLEQKTNTYQERKKENERLFPLFSEQAKARGINLPLPFGVSILGNVTNVHSSGDGLRVDFGNNLPSGDLPLKLEGDITAQITGVMLDFYPLPMLNLFGYAAYIRTSGNLDLGFKDSETVNVDFGDDGKAGGLGFNVAGGYDHFFVAVNASYSFSMMDKTGALKETMVITPRIGAKTKENNFQVWAGLMFMNKDSELSGTMSSESIGRLPEFDYIVYLQTPKYSPTIGFRYVPITHFEVVGEAFLASDFNGVNLRLAYRF